MSEQQSSNRVTWDSEVEYPDVSDRLRDGLRAIKDPELGLDIIQLGLVRNVTLTEENAVIKMVLTTPFCPYGPAMVDMTRQKAQEGLNLPVVVEMGMDVWDFSMMEDPSSLDWGLYA